MLPWVKLTVQPRHRIVRYKLKRIPFRDRTTQPLLGLQPNRMTGTIVIVESLDRLRMDFDFSAWSRQRRTDRIPAKRFERNKIAVDMVQFNELPFPGFRKRRDIRCCRHK